MTIRKVAATMPDQPPVTPLVAKIAAAHKVDLNFVTGTGIGGRIRKSDVLAAADTGPIAASVDEAALLAQLRAQTAASRAYLRPARGPAYAANPLVDQVKAAAPQRVAAAAAATGTVPALFASGGDLPAFTASGIDPQLLADIPWQGRHPVAAESDRSTAFAMIEAYGGPDGLELAEADGAMHPGNYAYEQRVTQWSAAAVTAAEVEAAFMDTPMMRQAAARQSDQDARDAQATALRAARYTRAPQAQGFPQYRNGI